MEEIWLPVKDYIGLYEVSNWGRVKSLKFGKERILKAIVDSYGYLIVNLYENGKMKTCRVHRLVAEAFLPNPEALPEVNHKNEDKQDNRVSNLEWCDRSYNINYSQAKQVAQLDKQTGKVIRIWSSTNEVQRQLGFDQGHISDCANGKRYKSAYGFKWRYVN